MSDGVDHRLAQHAGREGRLLVALPATDARTDHQVLGDEQLGAPDLVGQRPADGLAGECVVHLCAGEARRQHFRPAHPALGLLAEQQQTGVGRLRPPALADDAAATQQHVLDRRLGRALRRRGVALGARPVQVVDGASGRRLGLPLAGVLAALQHQLAQRTAGERHVAGGAAGQVPAVQAVDVRHAVRHLHHQRVGRRVGRGPQQVGQGDDQPRLAHQQGLQGAVAQFVGFGAGAPAGRRAQVDDEHAAFGVGQGDQ